MGTSLIVSLTLLAAAHTNADQLVETDWVAAHSAESTIRIVDMRAEGYETSHVPGAVSLGSQAIRDAKNPPTFLPTPAAFEELMTGLAVSNDSRHVYDAQGGVAAARLWWILNYFGHSDAALIHGRWTKWTAAPHWLRQAAKLLRVVGGVGHS